MSNSEITIDGQETWPRPGFGAMELGITVLAYSPLGRGFLTGRYKKPSDLDKDDFRSMLPRFQEENFAKNYKIVEEFEKLAKKKGCTAGQLSLAWLMSQGSNILPIPGTKSEKYLVENFDSRDLLQLNESELRDIRKIIVENQAIGDRYGGDFSKSLDE